MALSVKRHLDRRVAHQNLDLLGVVALLDPEGGAGVAEGVKAVFAHCGDRRLSRGV